MLLAPNIPRGNETTSVCLRALTCWAALEKSDFQARTRSYSETYILHKKGAHPWVSCLDGSETLCYHLIFSYKLSENSLANATQQILSRVRIHTMRFSQVWWLNLTLFFQSDTSCSLGAVWSRKEILCRKGLCDECVSVSPKLHLVTSAWDRHSKLKSISMLYCEK